jgi:hypothetical protein
MEVADYIADFGTVETEWLVEQGLKRIRLWETYVYGVRCILLG